MGTAPYLNPEAYAEATARAQAYLFATGAEAERATPGSGGHGSGGDSGGRGSGDDGSGEDGFGPDGGPSPDHRRRKAAVRPVRAGLLGVSVAVALGTIAVATGVVPGLDNYRLDGDSHTTGRDHVQTAAAPRNTASAQGGTSGSAEAGHSGRASGSAGGGTERPRSSSTSGSVPVSPVKPASPRPAPSKKAAEKPAPRTTPSKRPAPARPAEPGSPAEPAKPTRPAEPSAPATSAKPTVPTKPAEPTEPAEPSAPSTPAEPSATPKPAEPSPSSASAKPSAPATSAKPKPAPSHRTATKTPSPAKPKPAPSHTATKAPSAASAPVTVSQEAVVAAEVLNLVNEERAKAGCSPVAANSSLTGLAGAFTDDMAARGFFGDTDPDGRTPWDRAVKAGVTGLGGENIARGQTDAAAVMTAWMNSPDHRANILNCGFNTLGVGVHFGSGGPLWAQEFGF
ncbi:CAP domain-containing protein [Streptomyces echinatus]|uniref:CAP domain-containing protein n=1 Tax=Streptomyces echinatus TaxID=67293 RepID=UPI0038284D9D